MPRKLRVQFPGAIYHVTIRGNGREDIFADDHDRERFLRRLAIFTTDKDFPLFAKHLPVVLHEPKEFEP